MRKKVNYNNPNRLNKKNYLSSEVVSLLASYVDRVYSDGTPDDPAELEKWKAANPTHWAAQQSNGFHYCYVVLKNLKPSELQTVKQALNAYYVNSTWGGWGTSTNSNTIIIICNNNASTRAIRDDLNEKISNALGSNSYDSGSSVETNTSIGSGTGKYLIYGGIALAVIVVAYLLKKRKN